MNRRRAAEMLVGVPAATFLIAGLLAALIVLLVCGILAAVLR